MLQVNRTEQLRMIVPSLTHRGDTFAQDESFQNG